MILFKLLWRIESIWWSTFGSIRWLFIQVMNKDAFHLFGYGLYVGLDFCCSTKCNRNLDVCEGHQKTTSYACMCSATWYIPNTHAGFVYALVSVYTCCDTVDLQQTCCVKC